MRRAFLMYVVAGACWLGLASLASAAVTPGWECVPSTAGSAVVSGGTGSAPSCAAGSTAVLAPTYVSSGVGGKPTVQFSTVNVQVVSGSGSTSGAVNGEGNLVVGYAENANGHRQTGSNDLVVGANNGWASYGSIVGGANNQASGPYATALGASNIASGSYSLTAGHMNTASGTWSAALGGENNSASGTDASATGGEYNRATDPFSSISGGCDGEAGSVSSSPATALEPDDFGSGPPCTSGAESISGGQNNDALDPFSSVAGGCHNVAGTGDAANGYYDCAAGDGNESVTGGGYNVATGYLTSISAGQGNHAAGVGGASISGGDTNSASGAASISGGDLNIASGGASISGGESNTASGEATVIAGGHFENLSTEYDTRAGDTPFGP